MELQGGLVMTKWGDFPILTKDPKLQFICYACNQQWSAVCKTYLTILFVLGGRPCMVFKGARSQT